MKRYLLVITLVSISTMAHAQQRHADGIDNYLEYSPYAAMLVLKACGVKSQDDWTPMTLSMAATWVVTAGTATALKRIVNERRPDNSNHRSFPSAHTAITVAGATLLHKEFGKVSPWISVAGYGVATCVGIDRVLKDRHYWHDVAAGATLGFVMTEVTWWLSRKVLKSSKGQVMIGFGDNTLDLTVRF
ncbi:MAG: phosphatase PAP2 family protein [Bacteroidaceae bacterium]|nr:phosphatase PAP2 family protein [Bacteroidaceae bacterium]